MRLSITTFSLFLGCGISDKKAISDLDSKDWEKICKEYNDLDAFTCADSATTDMGTICEDAEETAVDCGDATVGDLRSCLDAMVDTLDADPCGLSDRPAECDWSDACGG